MGNVWYSGWEDNECYHHSILEKHKNLLEKMIKDRIFSIGFYDGKFFCFRGVRWVLFTHINEERST